MTATAETPEPYLYGWRYVQKTQPDGSTEMEQVPLTLEDVLHPQEGDVIIERPFHELDCRYLADVLASRPLGPAFAAVTADLLVDWGVAGVRDTSPDIGYFVGMREPLDLEKGTLRLANVGGRCSLAIEVVSPHTRVNDVEHKVRLYHQIGIPLYILIDQVRVGGPRRLVVYQWTPGGYVELPLDQHGRYLVASLGVYIVVHDRRVLCLDAATGRELGNYARLLRELEEADHRNQEQALALEEGVEQLRKAEKLAQDRAEAVRQAEKLAQDRAEALQQAEKLAQAQAEALQQAEKLTQAQAERAQDAEKLAKEQAERAANLEEQLRQLQALLANRPGDPPPAT
jgi:colicin import membrane protein